MHPDSAKENKGKSITVGTAVSGKFIWFDSLRQAARPPWQLETQGDRGPSGASWTPRWRAASSLWQTHSHALGSAAPLLHQSPLNFTPKWEEES